MQKFTRAQAQDPLTALSKFKQFLDKQIMDAGNSSDLSIKVGLIKEAIDEYNIKMGSIPTIYNAKQGNNLEIEALIKSIKAMLPVMSKMHERYQEQNIKHEEKTAKQQELELAKQMDIIKKDAKTQKIQIILGNVDTILADFKYKTGNIGSHLTEAKTTAKNLSGDLAKARAEYEHQLTTGMSSDGRPMSFEDAGSIFKSVCLTKIQTAMPVLERDLSWGDYLKNMAKAIANAVISVAQKLGSSATFFTPAKSDSVNKTAETNQKLQDIDVTIPNLG